MHIPFDNSYQHLPEVFHSPAAPAPFSARRLLAVNRELAEELRLPFGGYDENRLAGTFSGVEPPPGAAMLAQAYAGHQFGNFVPTLGDGRAVLLGEVMDRYGRRRDIHLKGAGRTSFSRSGDGLCPLGPALREYLVSEAMHALGVPTTRALALVLTDATAWREQPKPAAVIARVAASHVRVGTFQYVAARGDDDNVRRLADYVIQRHYPALAESDTPYRDLLAEIADRQARLITDWMRFGFIHGVMNTDNMAVSGETIDFGPCAFMDEFRADARFSFIDQHGRYAYANQPSLALWNLSRLAEAILPLLDADQDRAVAIAQDVLAGFMPDFEARWRKAMAAKIGLAETQEDDAALVQSLLEAMQQNRVDFTLMFRRLCDAVADPAANDGPRALFENDADWTAWEARWRRRLQAEAMNPGERARRMRAVNPAVIPRNHWIEKAIRAAEDADDFSVFERLRGPLIRPFEDTPDNADLVQPPAPAERVTQTFCGT
nr:YdiU family protein [Methylonatrum kenyense]